MDCLPDAFEAAQQAVSPACPNQERPRSLPVVTEPQENGMSIGQEEVTELLAARGGSLCFEVITQELGSGTLEREQAPPSSPATGGARPGAGHLPEDRAAQYLGGRPSGAGGGPALIWPPTRPDRGSPGRSSLSSARPEQTTCTRR
jgi:hypothetical protein